MLSSFQQSRNRSAAFDLSGPSLNSNYKTRMSNGRYLLACSLIYTIDQIPRVIASFWDHEFRTNDTPFRVLCHHISDIINLLLLSDTLIVNIDHPNLLIFEEQKLMPTTKSTKNVRSEQHWSHASYWIINHAYYNSIQNIT